MDGWDIAVGIKGGGERVLAESIPILYLFLGQGLLESVSQECTLVLFLRKPNLEVTSRSNCASVEFKFWKESKRSLEASVWREPDGLNPNLAWTQKAVRVPGQRGADLDDAFQMVRPLSLSSGPVGAPGRSPKVAPQRAPGNCPDGRDQAKDHCSRLRVKGKGPLLCVEHLDIISQAIKYTNSTLPNIANSLKKKALGG